MIRQNSTDHLYVSTTSMERSSSKFDPALWITAVLLVVVLIVVSVLFPAESMEIVLKPLNRVLHELLPGVGMSAGKIGHAIAFFLLTVLATVCSSLCKVRFIWLLVGILAFAIGTELSQVLVSGRTSQLKDLFLDFLGIAAALVVITSGKLIAHQLNFKTEENRRS